MLPLHPILITRQQYDEAVAQLPDPVTYPEPFIEVDVDAASLLRATNVKAFPGTEHWPMVVRFDKARLSPGLFDLDDVGSTCWQLSAGYRLI